MITVTAFIGKLYNFNSRPGWITYVIEEGIPTVLNWRIQKHPALPISLFVLDITVSIIAYQ
jgi:hypothetical protein